MGVKIFTFVIIFCRLIFRYCDQQLWIGWCVTTDASIDQLELIFKNLITINWMINVQARNRIRNFWHTKPMLFCQKCAKFYFLLLWLRRDSRFHKNSNVPVMDGSARLDYLYRTEKKHTLIHSMYSICGSEHLRLSPTYYCSVLCG